MPTCGSQVVLCDLPIRFDTYIGCSHDCKYCFVQRKKDLKNIKKGEGATTLINFIKGSRDQTTNWCDWNIPLHWGGISDPFQPIEAKYRNSYECLKVFKETQYPFIVSTKGKIICQDEYIKLIKDCNCVIQISLVCPEYDRLEKGAPPFQERLEMVRKLSKYKRVNIRIQPYMVEVHNSILKSIKQFADAGAYGIVIEGMKFVKIKPGLVKLGGDYVYPKSILESKFKELRTEAHKYGLKFYSGENRLRNMGDNLCCCGIEDLKGFKPNKFNINHMMNRDLQESTKLMNKVGTASAFKGIYQKAGAPELLKKVSFKDMMLSEVTNKNDFYKQMFGKK